MTEYELFYLIGESKDAEMARIKEEVKDIVEGEGGSYEGADKIEKRKLAYVVRREIRGTYIAQRFTTPGKDEREESIGNGDQSVIGRINHKLNLYRDVLRFMVVRAERLLPLHPSEEDASSKIVAEVVKEAQTQKAAVEKTVKNVARKVRTDEIVNEGALKKEKAVAKDKKASEVSEDDIDKKLEEVLNI